jgi:LacI family transcriptional regulator
MSNQVQTVNGNTASGGVFTDEPGLTENHTETTGRPASDHAADGRTTGRGATAGRATPVETGRGGGRPTMKDVASRAGVALKTVSRVVNGEPGVTPETANRVLGAIEALGFRRNESARLLRTGRTATLGFIADTWADPDHTAVYRGLENIAREHGYLLYSGSTDSDPDREERLALAMCARRVDGLIIIPAPGSHDYLISEMEAGVATVFVLRPPALVRADAVLPDERAAARTAITHLAAHGHRRIGFLGDPSGFRSQTLRDAYLSAMTAAGLAAEQAWATLRAEDLAHPDLPVTAVFCANQEQTRAALHALGHTLGGHTGAQGEETRIALVGFGDFDLADLVSPPVTVVSYDPVLIGYTAGELLIRRLGGEQAPPRKVSVPVSLIDRGSAALRLPLPRQPTSRLPRIAARMATTTTIRARMPILDLGAFISQAGGRSSLRSWNAWNRAVLALASLSVSGMGRTLPRHARVCGAIWSARSTSLDSTITLRVRWTNGSAAIRSTTCSKCLMSAALMCTSASASPVTVQASATSGCRRTAAPISSGVVELAQNSST